MLLSFEKERGTLMSCFFCVDLVIFGIGCVDTSLDKRVERVERGSRWIF